MSWSGAVRPAGPRRAGPSRRPGRGSSAGAAGASGSSRSGSAAAEATVDLGAQVPDEGGAGPRWSSLGDAGAEVGERAEVGQRPVGVDDVHVQGSRAGAGRRGQGERAQGGRAPAARPAGEQPGAVGGGPRQGRDALQVGLVDEAHHARAPRRRRGPRRGAGGHHRRAGAPATVPGAGAHRASRCAATHRRDHRPRPAVVVVGSSTAAGTSVEPPSAAGRRAP